MENSHRLKMVERDEWLRPAAAAIARRHGRYLDKLAAVVQAVTAATAVTAA